MWANFLKALISLGGILKMLENAWESVQEVRAKKKSEKRDAIIKQIDLARLEGDVEKIRKLAIKLNTLG